MMIFITKPLVRFTCCRLSPRAQRQSESHIFLCVIQTKFAHCCYLYIIILQLNFMRAYLRAAFSNTLGSCEAIKISKIMC